MSSLLGHGPRLFAVLAALAMSTTLVVSAACCLFRLEIGTDYAIVGDPIVDTPGALVDVEVNKPCLFQPVQSVFMKTPGAYIPLTEFALQSDFVMMLPSGPLTDPDDPKTSFCLPVSVKAVGVFAVDQNSSAAWEPFAASACAAVQVGLPSAHGTVHIEDVEHLPICASQQHLDPDNPSVVFATPLLQVFDDTQADCTTSYWDFDDTKVVYDTQLLQVFDDTKAVCATPLHQMSVEHTMGLDEPPPSLMFYHNLGNDKCAADHAVKLYLDIGDAKDVYAMWSFRAFSKHYYVGNVQCALAITQQLTVDSSGNSIPSEHVTCQHLGATLVYAWFMSDFLLLFTWAGQILLCASACKSGSWLCGTGLAQCYLVQGKWHIGTHPQHVKPARQGPTCAYCPGAIHQDSCFFACIAHSIIGSPPTRQQVRQARAATVTLWQQENPEVLQCTARRAGYRSSEAYLAGLLDRSWGGLPDLAMWSRALGVSASVNVKGKCHTFGPTPSSPVGMTLLLEDQHFSVLEFPAPGLWQKLAGMFASHDKHAARFLAKKISKASTSTSSNGTATGADCDARDPCTANERGGMLRPLRVDAADEELICARAQIDDTTMLPPEDYLRAATLVCSALTQVMGRTVGFFHQPALHMTEYVLTYTARITSPFTVFRLWQWASSSSLDSP
eukprot:3899428-Amphidinium_carterae.1